MKNRFARPVASAATALMLLGACSDDDPTTLATGEDVEFVGEDGLAGHTMDVSAEEQDGEVSGEVRFTDSEGHFVVTVECADTETDGEVILGGTITETTQDETGRMALIIREGDPDSAVPWFELPLPQGGEAAGSCGEFLESIPPDGLDDAVFAEVEAGSDIETG